MTRAGTPGICCDCGGDFPLPNRGRRLRCFACVKSLLGARRKHFDFSVFESEWNAGISVQKIAEQHGVYTATVYKAIRTVGAERKRTYTKTPELKSASDVRAQQMIDARTAGLTLEQIGEIHGVTRERARQILARFGLDSSNSGRKKAIDDKRAARVVTMRVNRDRRCHEAYGCTYQAMEALFGPGVLLTRHKATLAYAQHKKNSGQRGIEFLITFPQWWGVWQKSGKWAQRGRGQGYVMARTGDVGPYTVGNVYICTQSQNSKDSFIKTPGHVRAAKAAMNPRNNKHTVLGRGRGYTILKNCKTRPYQVMCGQDRVGYFATEEEARAAYLAACEAKRLAAAEFFKRAA